MRGKRWDNEGIKKHLVHEYWLLTFEVTLPFFDKASTSKNGGVASEQKNSEKSTITGTTSGRSGARDARWIQIIKFDWTDLGRLGRWVTPAVYIRYIDSNSRILRVFPADRREEGRHVCVRV